eukprot:gene4368-7724_t
MSFQQFLDEENYTTEERGSINIISFKEDIVITNLITIFQSECVLPKSLQKIKIKKIVVEETIRNTTTQMIKYELNIKLQDDFLISHQKTSFYIPEIMITWESNLPLFFKRKKENLKFEQLYKNTENSNFLDFCLTENEKKGKSNSDIIFTLKNFENELFFIEKVDMIFLENKLFMRNPYQKTNLKLKKSFSNVEYTNLFPVGKCLYKFYTKQIKNDSFDSMNNILKDFQIELIQNKILLSQIKYSINQKKRISFSGFILDINQINFSLSNTQVSVHFKTVNSSLRILQTKLYMEIDCSEIKCEKSLDLKDSMIKFPNYFENFNDLILSYPAKYSFISKLNHKDFSVQSSTISNFEIILPNFRIELEDESINYVINEQFTKENTIVFFKFYLNKEIDPILVSDTSFEDNTLFGLDFLMKTFGITVEMEWINNTKFNIDGIRLLDNFIEFETYFIFITSTINKHDIEMRLPFFSRDSVELKIDGDIFFGNSTQQKFRSNVMIKNKKDLFFKFK